MSPRSDAVPSGSSGVRGLLEAATLVRDEHDLGLALERVAAVVAETLGFEIVVVNLYRREWDDIVVATIYGDEETREHLLGCVYERAPFDRLLDPRFNRCGAYVIPEGAYDWSTHPGVRFVPEREAPAADDAWHPGDEIFVPFHSAAGELLGIFNVGEPVSGLRPSDEELETLVAAAGHAGLAVEAAQNALAGNRQRRALEHLLHVSGEISRDQDDGPPLQLVADAIHDALGFLKVSVDLVDGDGRLVPHSFTGWPADSPAVARAFPVAAVRGLIDPAFEIEGCYLVPNEAARRVVDAAAAVYSSELNGRGPHAWQNHWLLVPLHGRDGGLIGAIWADDPADRLKPSRETLQALRMFANQAAAAIESAKGVAALRELSATRARLLEQERRQVAHLQELDRLKDEFVALVSHELRTPLTSILGYTELLLEDSGYDPDDERRYFLAVVERGAHRLLAIVNDLLLAAQLEGGKLVLERRAVQVDELLAEAVSSGRGAAAAKQIAVEVEAEPGLVVEADRSRLAQVLDNLVSNAVKFTAPGGTVRLRSARRGDVVAIEVVDTGIGIPAAERDQLFTRFFRTSNARAGDAPGTGLGLAITRGIVESHGGSIDFESEEGVGTTFRVELPFPAAADADAGLPAAVA